MGKLKVFQFKATAAGKKNAELNRKSLSRPQKTVENSSKSTKPSHFFYFHQFLLKNQT
jgi:hypothetical protein